MLKPSVSSDLGLVYSDAEQQQWLNASVEQCRQATWQRLSGLDEAALYSQVHPEFSPIGWHLGHIAYIEAYWLLGQRGEDCFNGIAYRKLFAADGLPKAERGNLPPLEQLFDYVNRVRRLVLARLEQGVTPTSARLWRWILQHESQHSEIISFLRRMQELPEINTQADQTRFKLFPVSPTSEPDFSDMVQVEAGPFIQGSAAIDALDNERSPHWVELPNYWIDRYPVTQGQFAQFMAAGGYQERGWWSPAGWGWRQASGVEQPLYWLEGLDDHPVCGVSAHEAEAYCRFVGKRLPTEAEWEKAACWNPQLGRSFPYPWGAVPATLQSCNYNHHWGLTSPVTAHPGGQSFYGCCDLLGNVWEWTASEFSPYPQFDSYPYVGYSTPYFDGQHRVLRGGSYATQSFALRGTFRNWYQPGIRQILAGFRCAI